MQDSDFDVRLRVLVEAIGLVKEAYQKTKDRRIAAAALVLTELALNEVDKLGIEEGEFENE